MQKFKKAATSASFSHILTYLNGLANKKIPNKRDLLVNLLRTEYLAMNATEAKRRS
jgi:hypothetical protein